jgi:hypothetical protein
MLGMSTQPILKDLPLEGLARPMTNVAVFCETRLSETVDARMTTLAIARKAKKAISTGRKPT